jgi:CelD/BcsL family acetyltransferase involved in cellulose biosynthesis
MSAPLSAPAVMATEVVRHWHALPMLAAELSRLLLRSRADSVFLTGEWLRAWSRVAEGLVRPLVVTVRDGAGALIGMAPFYVCELRLGRVMRFRALRVMGDYPTGAEYPDWILDREHEAEAAAAIAQTLAGLPREWDCLWMPNVAGWTGARERILTACRAAGFFCRDRPVVFSSVPLPPTVEEYRRALSKNKRRSIRVSTERVLQARGAAFVRCRTAAELPEYLGALFDLNARRWEHKGQRGNFRRRPAEAVFYELFTPTALEKGWLRVDGLRDDAGWRAVQIGYVYNRALHAVQEGFDPEFIKGVGNALRAHVIESCIQEGVVSVDFLGGFNDEKKGWLAQERFGHDLFIGHRKTKNVLPFRGGCWPTGRFLRPSPWWLSVEQRASAAASERLKAAP